MSQLSKQDLKAENQLEFPNNNNGAITPSNLRAFNVDMIDSTVNQTSFDSYSASVAGEINALEAFSSSLTTNFVSSASFNTFSQSIDSRVDALEGATASYATSAITASSLVTASFNNGTRNLTFTKGDASTFAVNIPDVSGSTFNTGSFATTGSNTFTDNQTINGNISTSGADALTVNGYINTRNISGQPYTYIQAYATNAGGVSSGLALDANGSENFVLDNAFWNKGITLRNLSQNSNVFTVATGSTSPFQIQRNTDISGSLTASLQQGYVWVGNASGISTTVATSSFGSTINTGSFATTGSNTFIGNQNVEGDVTISGSGTNSNYLFFTRPNAGDIFRIGVSDNGNTYDFVITGSTNQQLWLIDNQGGTYLNTFMAPTNMEGRLSINNTFTASLQEGYAYVGNSSGKTAAVATSSFGGGGSTNTGSLLTTASLVNGVNLRFTKGDSSTFDVEGLVNTGSSTIFGTMTFESDTNAQARFEMSGSQYVGIQKQVGVNNLIWVDNTNDKLLTLNVDTRQFSVSGGFSAGLQQGYAWVGDNTGRSVEVPTSSFGGGAGTISVQDEGSILGTATSFNFNGAGVTATLSAGTASITIPGGGGSIDTGSFATTGSNTFRGDQTISFSGNNNLYISSSTSGQSNILLQSPVGNNLTAYGQLNIGNNGASGGSGSIRVVASSNQIDLAADSGVAIGPVNSSGNGVATGAIKLLAHSGSLILSNNSFTNSTSSLSHLSSSDNTILANFIFKANNNTGSTQISGSGNIFTNPTTPTAGYVRYVGGATNLFLNGQSQQLPQITGSAASVSGARPTMNANIINGTSTWTINQSVNPGTHTYSNNILAGAGAWTFNMLGNTGTVQVFNNLGLSSTMTLNSPSQSVVNVLAGVTGSNGLTIQNNTLAGTFSYLGPVSSSTHIIQQNNIAGTLTMNVQSGSRAYSISQNITNGSLTINDNTVFAPTLGSTNSISQNNINGSITLTNRASASFSISANNLSGFTISNDYDSSTNGTNGKTFVLQGNALIGFINNNVYFSGSANGTGTTNDRGRGLYGNIMGGSRISASVIGDGNRNLIASAIVGHGLNIYGTSLYDASNAANAGGQNGGSAFFGRWNAEDGNRANSSETVFAVGTGNSGSAGITRKTGFLIDSGSNSFFEGTLNVSGSTTLSGSLTIQSGSAFFANGNKQFNVGVFQSDVTQSGSANVSQSMNFETTDISEGVSIASNSRITLANAGTYNIQFSVQVDRVSGSGTDTVHIWLKKNGTNVDKSAGAITISGGASAAKTVASWNYVVNAAANDYYELVWQSTDSNIQLINQAATGNIPSTPSVILTVTQVK